MKLANVADKNINPATEEKQDTGNTSLDALHTHINDIKSSVTLDALDEALTITLDEALPAAPANGDAFDVNPVHVHPISQIADTIWDEATSGHSTAGTTGKAVTDILADTNELQTDWVDGGRLDLILDARASQTSVNTIDDFVDTEIGTIITDIAAVKTDTAAILLDTGTDGVVIPQAQADKVWDTTTRTLTNIGIKKNTALANFEFFMVDSTDHITGKTGLTVTATRSIDGAAFGACANAVTEVANGIYKISLATTDLNGDVVTLKMTATGADTRILTIITTA